jgi:8-oxo-dGTP diphosphatase
MHAMQPNYIDKLAFIYLQDKKILTTLSKGNDTWYIPGGKRESGESDIAALIREVKEELSVSLRTDTIHHYATFEAQAHAKPQGTIVRMTCYMAKFDGQLRPASEIAQLDFVGYEAKAKSSAVDGLIFDDLYKKGLIHKFDQS